MLEPPRLMLSMVATLHSNVLLRSHALWLGAIDYTLGVSWDISKFVIASGMFFVTIATTWAIMLSKILSFLFQLGTSFTLKMHWITLWCLLVESAYP